MKQIFAVGFGVAALIVFLVWGGIGFGLGALSVTPTTAPQGFTYHESPFTKGDSMEWAVHITSWTQSGDIPTTAILASGASTVVTFSLEMRNPSGDDCGNSGNPVWHVGGGADWGAWQVSLGGQSFTIQANNGTSYQSTNGLFDISLNSTGAMFYCLAASGGCIYSCGDVVSPDLTSSGGNETLFSESVRFIGQYTPTTLVVSLIGMATSCNGAGTITGVCYAADNDAGGSNGGSPNGGIPIDASASITTYSGQAYVQVTNPGQLAYNGQSLNVQVTTGYDGAGGYQLTVNYPPARGGSTPDPAFPSIQVPNFCEPCTYHWVIPNGTSVNSTKKGYNNFVVALTANFLVQGTATAFIDIAPRYAPTMPIIEVTDSGTYTSPQVGNTETVTVLSNATASSGEVTNIQLWVFYVETGLGPANLPSCGELWVPSIPCPGGLALTTTVHDNASSATFSFVVDPPAGATAIGIQASGESNEAQSSPVANFLVNIVPQDCAPGAAGCPTTQQSAGIWQEIGPWLLAAGIVLLSLFLVFLPPKLPTWILVVGPIATVVVLILLWSLITGAFNPGGALNATG